MPCPFVSTHLELIRWDAPLALTAAADTKKGNTESSDDSVFLSTLRDLGSTAVGQPGNTVKQRLGGSSYRLQEHTDGADTISEIPELHFIKNTTDTAASQKRARQITAKAAIAEGDSDSLSVVDLLKEAGIREVS